MAKIEPRSSAGRPKVRPLCSHVFTYLSSIFLHKDKDRERKNERARGREREKRTKENEVSNEVFPLTLNDNFFSFDNWSLQIQERERDDFDTTKKTFLHSKFVLNDKTQNRIENKFSSRFLVPKNEKKPCFEFLEFLYLKRLLLFQPLKPYDSTH